jgi:hypothetical protein
MPPNSTMLTEEGAVFKSLKIVENNIFNEQGSKIYLYSNLSNISIFNLKLLLMLSMSRQNTQIAVDREIYQTIFQI